jgi:hypothetical protein
MNTNSFVIQKITDPEGVEKLIAAGATRGKKGVILNHN